MVGVLLGLHVPEQRRIAEGAERGALLLVDAGLTTAYFLDLRPEVNTSCCGSLFGKSGTGLAGGLSGPPSVPTAITFFGVIGVAVAAAAALRFTGRVGAVVAIASGLALPVSLAAIIAVVSPYAYALPSHHCPFCLLQREYHFVGYVLYAATLSGGVTGIATGVVGAARAVPSLTAIAPSFQRRLGAAAALSFAILGVVSAALIVSSELKL